MTLNRKHELETFKISIDLPSYMASQGYVRDQRQSSQRYHVMKHANGEKLNVTRGSNRHWKYVNTHDSGDSGSIVDFLQIRHNCSIGEVRKMLRPWITQSLSLSPCDHVASNAELPLVELDTSRAAAAWRAALPIHGTHNYLEQERCIARSVLDDPIFRGRIRQDQRWKNALFAHHDRHGLCGFEIKNSGVTMFSRGGTRGLFTSRVRDGDEALVVSETAVDSLSFAALYGTQGKRFVSTGGQVSTKQQDLLQAAARKLPPGGKVVLALDNDQGGENLCQVIEQALQEIGFPEKAIEKAIPENPGDDWNDVLRRSAPRSRAHLAPEFSRL